MRGKGITCRPLFCRFVCGIKFICQFSFLCLGVCCSQGQTRSVPSNVRDTLDMKADSLKPVLVTATIHPHLRGDTLEYNSENIKMQPNATVEEMLRRLPGLVVDGNGNITFNGQKIDKLLVDGEDIFGSSPTAVTRNFDASKIGKVQILDRKADQAIFTGVDDGIRIKTLNLVLKESARNGYFGKLEVGGNADGDYNGSGYIAGFRDKEQFTALGMAANTGVPGGQNNAGVGNGDGSFVANVADPLGATAGVGIPHFVAGGLHYADTWNGTADHFSTNYQYSHLFTVPVASTVILQVEPNNIYSQMQQSNSISRQSQHWLYGIYDWTVNRLSTVTANFYGKTNTSKNDFQSISNSGFNEIQANASDRSMKDVSQQQDFGGEVSWRIQNKVRTSRAFSVIAMFDKKDFVTRGSLYSLDKFYAPSGLFSSFDTVDQHKLISSRAVSLGVVTNYTQPLWNKGALVMGYEILVNGDHPLQSTYDRGDGKYTALVDSLSSHFKVQMIHQRSVVNLQGIIGRMHYTIGADLIGYRYWQRDLTRDSLLTLQYIDWAPKMFLHYTAGSATSVYFNYNAKTQNPNISQLAPLENNTDPLHITLGNPNLKPSLIQNFRLDFRRVKASMIDAIVMMSLNNNSISTRTVTDSLGRQVSQPVNVDGDMALGSTIMMNRKIRGFDLGVHAFGDYTRMFNYVNADLTRNDIYTGGGGISLNKYVTNRYSFQLNTNFGYFDQISNINTTAPTHYWTQSHQGTLTFLFVRSFEINTNAFYSWQEKTNSISYNTSVLLWNAYVSRSFGHNNWVVKFQMNNIFNANSGIVRSNTGNVNSQSSTNILGRYWMFSVTYHFDRKFRRK